MKKIAYFILATLMLAGCSKESDLKMSIFIPDSDDPRLPAYSEWGYNTFGAILNDDAFTSEGITRPLTINASSNTTEFCFEGYQDHYFPYNNSKSTTLTIKSSSIHLNSAEDLASLNGKTLQLSDLSVEVYIGSSGQKDKAIITKGTLTFNRIQRVTVDKKYTQMIISGYFEMIGKVNGTSFLISDGRFDFGIRDYYNLYILQ